MPTHRMIAVIGSGEASSAACELAFFTGREIALRGAALLCGGRRGVMEDAARGAQSAGGVTIGILPGYDRSDANPYIEVVIATGMGQARNAIIVASSDAIIALEGEGGTLSEIGLAIKLGRPVIALRAWTGIADIAHADDPKTAVSLAFEMADNAAIARAR